MRLWSIKTRAEVCAPLVFHTLTVTAIAFSKSSRYLLTAGRDRSWALYDTSHLQNNECQRIASFAKAHTRIIWEAVFTPCENFFLTASRDKTVKVWEMETKTVIKTIEFNAGVTSVDIQLFKNRNLLVVGLENGDVHLVDFDLDMKEILPILQIPYKHCHNSKVNSVKWRPNSKEGLFASCSDDCSVRILQLKNFQ